MFISISDCWIVASDPWAFLLFKPRAAASGGITQPRCTSCPDPYFSEEARADRGREMGKIARINAKKKFCANDVIPAYGAYYKRVLAES
jgi:hypothetical protein